MELGERIATLREERAQTQVELAEAARISPSTLSQIESGKVPRPHVGTVRKIARALGIEPAELRRMEEPALPKAQAPLPDFGQERRQLRTEVETFISDAQEALDYPDLTQDVAYQISEEATDLLLKAIDVKNSASREKGYSFKELNDIASAYNQIMAFSETASQTFLNKSGESTEAQKLEERRLRLVEDSA